jgi:hypothetical protein
MLDDLRPVVADILDDLADALPLRVGPSYRFYGLSRGAATLRYVHAEIGGPDPDELAELEYLRGQLEAIEEALTARDANGKTLAAAQFRARVKEIVGAS